VAIKKYRPAGDPKNKRRMRRVDADAIDLPPAKPKYDPGSKKRQVRDRKPTHTYKGKTAEKNIKSMGKKRMQYGKAGGRKSTKYRKGRQTQGYPTANNTYEAGR
jgi:hypothetical protein